MLRDEQGFCGSVRSNPRCLLHASVPSRSKHDDITVTVAEIVPEADDDFVDPYFEETIYLYTGDVGTVEDLPDPETLIAKPQSVGGEEL